MTEIEELYETLSYAAAVLDEFLDSEIADWDTLQVLKEEIGRIQHKYNIKP